MKKYPTPITIISLIIISCSGWIAYTTLTQSIQQTQQQTQQLTVSVNSVETVILDNIATSQEQTLEEISENTDSIEKIAQKLQNLVENFSIVDENIDLISSGVTSLNEEVELVTKDIDYLKEQEQFSESISNVISEAWKTVVAVSISAKNPMPGMTIPGQGGGTGFFIEMKDENTAYVVTNHHVIEGYLKDGGRSLELIITTGTHPWEYDAKVVGSDAIMDIAVLSIEKKEFEVWEIAEWADTPYKEGDWVVAIGHGLGLYWTTSKGVITNATRITGPKNFMIQHDAPINQGNSGGPLFDLHGKVVGVNDLIISPSARNRGQAAWDGIAMAIPSWQAKHSVNEIIKNGKVDYVDFDFKFDIIGIDQAKKQGEDWKDRNYGIIRELGDYAKSVGLQEGDLLLEINDVNLRSGISFLLNVLAKLPGDTVEIKIKREEEVLVFEYELKKYTPSK